MKANFLSRLIAYFVDSILVIIIASLITMGFQNEKLDEYNEELQTIMNDYTSGEVTMEEYLESTTELTYNINKESIIINSISLLVTIIYFSVFQYLNKGQTIGKKLFKLKVVENGKDPSLKAIIIRTFIINGIIISLLDIVFVGFIAKNNYYYASSVINYLYYGIIIASSVMILYRKDKRGLHDLIAKTEVISERG